MSFVSFIIAGLVQQVVVCMIIAIALMIGTLLVIRAVTAKKHAGVFQEMAAANKLWPSNSREAYIKNRSAPADLFFSLSKKGSALF